MMDKWNISASSGEYVETADSAIIALAQFMTSHPDDFVHAVVCDLSAELPPMTKEDAS